MPGQQEKHRHDVFISYSHEDLATVLPDVEWLKVKQHDVWFDANIHAGSVWADELAQAIDNSQFILFFASANSIVSPNCLNEIAYATDANKIVVPIYMEQLQITRGLKLSVSRSQAILRWQLSLEEYRQQLRSALAQHGQAVQDAAAAAEISHTTIWSVPATRNRNFEGRESLFEQINEHIRDRAPAIIVLTGLAGVGKSQLALEYAYRHKREYDLVAWIRGAEVAALEADLVALAAELSLEQANDANTAIVLNAVKRYLASRASWLLILDNVERPDMLTRYLPADVNGHVIVTSRRQNWGRHAEPLSIDEFRHQEALSFIERRLPQADPAANEKLVEVLGRLPLALEDAAAYMEATGRSTASYLELFENHHRALLKEAEASTDDHGTFRTALEVSLRQLEADDEVAAHVLKLLAFVAPDDISIPLLIGEEFTRHSDLPLEMAVDRSVSALRKYSLLKVKEDAVAMHRLVQLVVRDRMSSQDYARYATRTMELVEGAFPKIQMMGKQATRCRRLIPHAVTLFGHAENVAAAQKWMGTLLGRTGMFLSASGRSEEALRFLDRAYLIYKDQPDSPVTLAYTCELYGSCLYGHGLLGRARDLFDESLELYKQADTPKANRKLGIYIQLAWINWGRSDFGQAELCAKKSLTITEAEFGSRDPRRIGALSILSRVYMDNHRLAEAQSTVDEAVNAIERLSGFRMPLMCGVFMQLAYVLLSLGKPQRAQSWTQEALAVGTAALSETHPLIATAHCVQGQILLVQGELEAAHDEFEAAVSSIKLLRYRLNQHMFVAICFLIRTLIELGDLKRAQQLVNEHLVDFRDRIAGDHSYAQGMASLVKGLLHCKLGDSDHALTLSRQGEMQIRDQFGAMHSYRMDSLLLLGNVERELQMYSVARATYEEGLKIAHYNNLDGHPLVAAHLLGISAIDEAQDKANTAEVARRQAGELLSACLGPTSKAVLSLQTEPQFEEVSPHD